MAHAALLVVHGIGAQQPGETLAKVVNGLRGGRPHADAIHDGMALTVGERMVRVYEVYWADVLEGPRSRGAFQMDEVQSVSWFPWYNTRCGNYPAGTYSFLKLTWWIVALPLLNFFLLWGYYGARVLLQISTGERSPARGKQPSRLDVILDEFAGDIFSYVNSAGSAFYRDGNEPAPSQEVERSYAEIVGRFYDQLVRAEADGCDTIQIVAHSLGTVVAYHALSCFAFDRRRPDVPAIEAALSKVSHLYTIGSPLEKVRFFWPRIVPVAGARKGVTLRWENFVSYFDPVSGTLRSFRDWGGVSNTHLLGGGFFRGHVVYERSPVFLGALTEGLCGRAIRFERTRKERLWDAMLLAGETLIAPIAVGVVLAIGAALFLLAVTLLPFLASLPFRFFLKAAIWAPWVDRASYVILGLFVLTFLVAPMNRARTVHAMYWNENRRPERSGHPV